MTTKTNDLLKNYSGIFGNLVVLKNRRGNTIMIIPKARRPQKPSEKQIAYRRKFQLASLHATKILEDPEVLSDYRTKARKGQTAYNLALKDYLVNPLI